MSVLRIANASGFYGDRAGAFQEMLEGGPVDVITGDYLAELTMLILARDRSKDPSTGYAKTFLAEMQQSLALAMDRGVKIVVNAGGLNPKGLADKLTQLAETFNVKTKIAHVHGDDLIDRAEELGLTTSNGTPLSANAYLGGWGIAAALRAGADIVVTGRVTDASLVVGAAAQHFGWKETDYNEIAGAMAAGHVIECGTQATGGNYAFFDSFEDMHRPGFPIAEIEVDGSSTITKHPGTGGAVTAGTVTAQLVYEITGARYAGPDAILRLDSINLEETGPDRVRLSGIQGEAPPDTLKVSINALGGFRNEVTFVLTGLDIEKKAALIQSQIGQQVPEGTTWTLARTDHDDAATEEQASAMLHCMARGQDQKLVGRAFSNAAVQIGLASYPGFHLTAPPGDAAPYGVYTPGWVRATQVRHLVTLPDGTTEEVPPHPGTVPSAVALAPVEEPTLPPLPSPSTTARAPLGRVAAARSGDKGGDANVGVWVERDDAWPWLVHTLTVEALKELLPDTKTMEVERHVFPKLHAVNFVIRGLLGEGVASNARFDAQAKALGEWLRARHLEIPEEFL
ncbi:acyclic terpene utilization AtuA family protein [Arthrobacter sp. AQ5-05]|uniref:acyclic terpene utilization AtuA family protein n=1 Tax=Arthrobacter sp. AQ5-05 TaxID=2184581 RepID=UPI0012B59BEA|nr:acyclic terpene utilization AtuA family protein [Arthrobacter sp. AQ5-05]